MAFFTAFGKEYLGTIFLILLRTKLIIIPFNPKNSPTEVIKTFLIDVSFSMDCKFDAKFSAIIIVSDPESFNCAFNSRSVNRGLILSIIFLSISSACSQRENYPPIQDSNENSFELVKIVDGIDIPWGLAFTDNTSFLVTDKKGILYHVVDGKKKIINLDILK